MPTTPEPQTARAHTPPTPLHGPKYDTYEPYSPRRSTRTTAQNNPYSSQRHTTPPPTIKKARFARAPTQLSSPPSSPVSPARTRQSPRQYHKSPKKGLLSSARKATSASAASLSDSDHPTSSSLAPPNIDPADMLPTPSKTPKKRNAAALHSTARILSFQPENPNDVMPLPRKIKKHGRFNSMNGFDLYDEETEAPANGGIEIFTDASARIPDMDGAEDNPFVGPRRATEARPQRRSRRSQTAAEEEMEEAARRDEGVVYVFRGKKIFRRFSDPEPDLSSSAETDIGETSSQRTLRRQAGVTAQRPLTRSSIKPRLLFPTEEQLHERQNSLDDVDEEAATDIETEMPTASSPVKQKGEARTPRKNHARQLTPPTTARVTRTKKATPPTPAIEEESEPMSLGSDGTFPKSTKSPFDSWQRTKPGRKRAGEASEVTAGAKRTRSSVAESSA